MRPLRHSALLVSLALTGCIDVGPFPAADTQLELTATDWTGRPYGLLELPRMPRLRLRHPGGIAPEEDAVVLFPGSPTDAWRVDLERAPLLERHKAELIPLDFEATSEGATAAPGLPLETDSPYVLAVASWAKSRGGQSINTDDEPSAVFQLRTAPDRDAGAQLVWSWPADGTNGIGTNLVEAVLAFDGEIHGAEEGMWLQAPDGRAIAASVTVGRCDGAMSRDIEAEPSCVHISPTTRLEPNARHDLVIGDAAHDAHGAPLGPWRSSFRTAAGPDRSPPALIDLACARDERAQGGACALLSDLSVGLRLRTEEAVIASLRGGPHVVSQVAPAGELAIRITDLLPNSALELLLSLRDSAGNTAERSFSLGTPGPLATVSIMEVLADPLGPEPDQELIELYNYGDAPVDLTGFTLSDRADAPGSPLPAGRVLGPETRALLVSDDFESDDGRDAAPPEGASLIRVGRALAGSGLSNAGEALYLRDPDGHRVSAAPANPSPRPGVCVVRISRDMRDGSDGTFAYEPDGTCTPGR
jgi:hypothetical protein